MNFMEFKQLAPGQTILFGDQEVGVVVDLEGDVVRVHGAGDGVVRDYPYGLLGDVRVLVESDEDLYAEETVLLVYGKRTIEEALEVADVPNILYDGARYVPELRAFAFQTPRLEIRTTCLGEEVVTSLSYEGKNVDLVVGPAGYRVEAGGDTVGDNKREFIAAICALFGVNSRAA